MGRAEVDALFGHLRELEEGDHLEAPRVGEEAPLPGHEGVESAALVQDLFAWPQSQVVGVAQND